VELAKAELEEISGAAKRAAGFGGIAAGLGIFALLLLAIGGPMFLGEWLFGSIGWGILLGTEWLIAGALAGALLALEPAIQAHVGRSFTIALVVGILFGVVAGAGLTNRFWTAIADTIATSIEPGVRPLVVAMVVVGIIGAVVGLVVGLSNGGPRTAITGLVVGAVLGVTMGGLTAVNPGPRVGAALGMEIGLIVWIVLMVRTIAGGEFDTEKLKARYWPTLTIETTKETIEWARARMPLAKRS